MNILLVEDEPPILRDLKSLIEFLNIPDTTIITASNGKEALDYLDNHFLKIDLVITDIHMPVIDGLELISQISSRYSQIICIILTGYSEFEYAKTALKLGVYDYLLKPVDENDLEQLLKRVHETLCIKKLTKNVETNSIASKKQNASSSVKSDVTYSVAVLCLGSFPIQSTNIPLTADHIWDSYQLKQHLSAALSAEDTFWIIDGTTTKEKNIIFTFHNSHKTERIQLLNKVFKSILSHSAPISVAFHGTLKNMKFIRQTVQELRNCLNDNIILGKSCLMNCEALSEQKDPQFHEMNDILKTLIQSFSALQIRLFQNELLHLINLMESMELNQKTVFKYLYDFTYPCLSDNKYHEFTKYINCNEFLSDVIVLSSSFKSLYHNLYSAFYDIFESILHTKDNNINKEQLLLKLDSYIISHYNQPISTLSLADEFGFSPAYLSKMFREYKQISPSEYIIHLRIEKAQKLFLTNPKLKIKEVSTLVGYEDSLYFSKVFKKMTGKSPRQFIKPSI